MKYKYNNEWKEMNVKVSDTLPIGSVVEYDGEVVPSGWEEVEDTGSNKNGSWIKYTNGVMICWHTIVGNIFNNTQAAGNGYYYYTDTNNSAENAKRWYYPLPFLENTQPTISVTVASSGYTMSSATNINNTYANGLCVMTYPTSSIRFYWHFMAIGRWK